ncbi:hypothetical protein M0811_09159 [Anaeramoeba ignava]|uniref:Uncharacterized protein n=1 Tax=Anaeramoeba ignava TaxID=1746090 RepID=A0A9Q0LJG9_ANAIG|nr:hypothetical protein M0811_09159 [Anaeramoeba ignava]
MSNFSIQTRALLYRVLYHPNINILKTNSKETFDRSNPTPILTKWANFQIQKTQPNFKVEDFSKSFENCEAFVYLISEISAVDLTFILSDPNIESRVKQLIQKMPELGYQEFIPSEDDILNGNEEQIVIFLAKLFIWKPNLKTEPNQIISTFQENKTEPKSTIPSRISPIKTTVSNTPTKTISPVKTTISTSPTKSTTISEKKEDDKPGFQYSSRVTDILSRIRGKSGEETKAAFSKLFTKPQETKTENKPIEKHEEPKTEPITNKFTSPIKTKDNSENEQKIFKHESILSKFKSPIKTKDNSENEQKIVKPESILSKFTSPIKTKDNSENEQKIFKHESILNKFKSPIKTKDNSANEQKIVKPEPQKYIINKQTEIEEQKEIIKEDQKVESDSHSEKQISDNDDEAEILDNENDLFQKEIQIQNIKKNYQSQKDISYNKPNQEQKKFQLPKDSNYGISDLNKKKNLGINNDFVKKDKKESQENDTLSRVQKIVQAQLKKESNFNIDGIYNSTEKILKMIQPTPNDEELFKKIEEFEKQEELNSMNIKLEPKMDVFDQFQFEIPQDLDQESIQILNSYSYSFQDLQTKWDPFKNSLNDIFSNFNLIFLRNSEKLRELYHNLPTLKPKKEKSRAETSEFILVNGVFSILKSHKISDIPTPIRSQILKEIMSIPKLLKIEAFFDVYKKLIDLLESKNIIKKEQEDISNAIRSLFIIYCYKKILRNEVIKVVNNLFPNEEIERTKEEIEEAWDKIINVTTEKSIFQKIIKLILETTTFSNPDHKSKELTEHIFNNAYGETTILLMKIQIPEESKKQIQGILEKGISKTETQQSLQYAHEVLADKLSKSSLSFIVITFENFPEKETFGIGELLYPFLSQFGIISSFTNFLIFQQIFTSISAGHLVQKKTSILGSILHKYAKEHAFKYFVSTFSDLITRIVNEKIYIDISGSDENRNSRNLPHLQKCFGEVIELLMNSISQIPNELRYVGYLLKSKIMSRFPDSATSVVCSYFIQNFVAYGIKNPEKFDIIDFPISENAKLGLCNLSTAIKTFSRGSTFPPHKPQFQPLNTTIISKFSYRSRFVNELTKISFSDKEKENFDIPYCELNTMNLQAKISETWTKNFMFLTNIDQAGYIANNMLDIALLYSSILKKDINFSNILGKRQLANTFESLRKYHKKITELNEYFSGFFETLLKFSQNNKQLIESMKQKEIEKQIETEIQLREKREPQLKQKRSSLFWRKNPTLKSTDIVHDNQLELYITLWDQRKSEKPAKECSVGHSLDPRKQSFSSKFIRLIGNLLGVYDEENRPKQTDSPSAILSVKRFVKMEYLHTKKKHCLVLTSPSGFDNFFALDSKEDVENWIKILKNNQI